MNKEICIKGDGTEEYGKKIILYLESLGGYNLNWFNGSDKNYYYINLHNIIGISGEIPSGYTEISLKKEFPRKMLVSDNHLDWTERLVLGIFDIEYDKPVCAEYYNPARSKKSVITWRYAKEIEIVEEMTLEEVCEKLGKKIKIITKE